MYFYNYEYFKVESIKLLLNQLGVEHYNSTASVPN